MNEKKENRKITYTKKAIKDALHELLRKKPLRMITVKEICEYADINRGTFYIHYEDIYDLVDKIENEEVEQVREETKNIFTDDKRMQLDFEHMKPMFDAMTDSERSFWFFDDNFNGYGIDILFNEQADAIIDWYTRMGLSKTESEYLYSYLIGGTIRLLKEWYKKGFGRDEQIVYQTLVDMTDIAEKYLYDRAGKRKNRSYK